MITATTILGYISLAAMKAQYPNSCVGKTDDQVKGAIAWAENIINDCTSDFFSTKTLTLRLNGTGSEGLYLKNESKGLRLVSVQSLTDTDTGTAYDDLCYDIYDYHLMMRLEPMTRAVGLQGAVWPEGIGNIVLVGTFGRAAIPPMITRATALLASLMLTSNSDEGPIVSGQMITGETIGGYSYNMRGIERNVMETRATGVSEVDMILSKYTDDMVDITVTTTGFRRASSIGRVQEGQIGY